jgi:hypothetical protein
MILHFCGALAGLALLAVALYFAQRTGRLTAPYALADDLTPPDISGIHILSIDATSSIVTWDTDEPATSYVNYGITKSLGVANEPTPYEKTHEIQIGDLEPATTYFFRVFSIDAAGNQSFSGTYQFTTKGTKQVPGIEQVPQTEQQVVQQISELIQLKPPKILGIPELDIGSDQVTIRWQTDRDANSLVDFADENAYRSGGYNRTEGDADIQTSDHEVALHGLTPQTTYHYQITSRSTVGPTGTTEDRTFTTKSLTPQIVGAHITQVQEDSATVVWSTQIPASGLAEYTNLNTKEMKSLGDPSQLYSHTIRLPDLKFKSPYQVVIHARAGTGDEVVSQPLTFVTTKDETPPVIGQVNNESTLYPGADVKVQTIITWITDKPSICQFYYTEGVAAKEDEAKTLPEETGPLLEHVQVVTDFSPSTAYKFWLSCRDHNNNTSRSEDFVLYTPDKEKSIIDIIIENFKSTFGWVNNIGK